MVVDNDDGRCCYSIEKSLFCGVRINVVNDDGDGDESVLATASAMAAVKAAAATLVYSRTLRQHASEHATNGCRAVGLTWPVVLLLMLLSCVVGCMSD